VETICGEFDTVNLSSMLWALAAMGRVPAPHAMRLIERRLEEILGDLTSSELATTLWALANFFFLGKNPGDQLLGLLERRAEEISVSGEFDSQVLSLRLLALLVQKYKY
jgi:hypothetical protein